jgi:hypothetical protein
MHKITWILCLVLLYSVSGSAQSKDEKDIAAAVEKMRIAMVDADKDALEKLASPQLSYGHSTGYVDTRESFIADLLSRKSDFTAITLTDQTITVVDNTALVRHKLAGKTNDIGKGEGAVKLSILLVWVRQNNEWKLLARQAVKI